MTDLDPAAIMAAHSPTPVHQYDDVNGVFVYGEDDDLVTLHLLCSACTLDDRLEELGDCLWSEDDPGSTYWPCEPYRLAAEVAAMQEQVQQVGALAEEWATGCGAFGVQLICAQRLRAVLAGEGAAEPMRAVSAEVIHAQGEARRRSGEGAADQPQPEVDGWRDIAHGVKQPCRCEECQAGHA